MSTSHTLPGASALARLPRLSPEAKKRLSWMDHYRKHGNATLTCRYFGISRETFHKWLRRYDPRRLESLEEKSRRPKKTRQWEVSRIEEFRILSLRRAHIRYGKMKLRILYAERYGKVISSWRVQRVIEKHQLYYRPKETAKMKAARARGRKKKRITDLKKEAHAGFLVALDTVVRYIGGRKRYILTGIDVHSKIALARMYPTKHSRHAADFLLRLRYLFEGKIENLQTDNGSEFAGEFREAAEALSLPHWFSRNATPTDNPVDERFNGTLEREFLQMGNMTDDCNLFNRKVMHWLIEYNFQRPHQTLHYATPVVYHAKQSGVSGMYPSSTDS